MPTEAEVLELVRDQLPTNSLIRGVVEYGWGGATDTPLAFLMHAGIHVAGMGLPGDTLLRLGTPIKANFYSLVLGPTGARKTTALRTVAEIVKDGLAVEPLLEDTLIIDAASREGVIRLLGKQGKRLVLITEGGDWFKLTDEKGYQAPLRPMFLRMYDGDELRHETKDVKKTLKPVRSHCASVLMACTPSHVERHTTRSEWESGFMNRFGICYAEQEREYDEPEPNPRILADLVTEAAERARVADSYGDRPPQPVGWDPNALDLWRAWNARWKQDRLSFTEGELEATARYATHALKLAMIASHDIAVLEPDWQIPEAAAVFATTVADWCVHDALRIYKGIAGNRYEVGRNAVLAVMRWALPDGEESVSYRDIAKNVTPKMKKRDLMDILESMISEGSIFNWPGSRYGLKRPPIEGMDGPVIEL